LLGHVEIHFGTRRVRREGKDVRLTPKELDVLQYLARHPNTPVTHARLLQAIWGPDYGNEVANLRVIINQLRKKIELDPGDPRYLITEPWVGYRLAVPGATNNSRNP
jgi:two-component system KDP operon response regulator KdpE